MQWERKTLNHNPCLSFCQVTQQTILIHWFLKLITLQWEFFVWSFLKQFEDSFSMFIPVSMFIRQLELANWEAKCTKLELPGLQAVIWFSHDFCLYFLNHVRNDGSGILTRVRLEERKNTECLTFLIQRAIKVWNKCLNLRLGGSRLIRYVWRKLLT